VLFKEYCARRICYRFGFWQMAIRQLLLAITTKSICHNLWKTNDSKMLQKIIAFCRPLAAAGFFC
jgi:hypothetical protein